MKSSFEALRGASGRGRMGAGKRFSGFVLRYGCFASLLRTSVDVAASKQKIPLRHRELLRRFADEQLAVRGTA